MNGSETASVHLRLKRDGISRNETKSSRKSTEVVSQPSNVINFGVSTNNQPISPMPATDTISPIPEVMPGDNNGNTPPTFM